MCKGTASGTAVLAWHGIEEEKRWREGVSSHDDALLLVLSLSSILGVVHPSIGCLECSALPHHVGKDLIDVDPLSRRGLVVRHVSPRPRQVRSDFPGDLTLRSQVGLVAYENDRDLKR